MNKTFLGLLPTFFYTFIGKFCDNGKTIEYDWYGFTENRHSKGITSIKCMFYFIFLTLSLPDSWELSTWQVKSFGVRHSKIIKTGKSVSGIKRVNYYPITLVESVHCINSVLKMKISVKYRNFWEIEKKKQKCQKFQRIKCTIDFLWIF